MLQILDYIGATVSERVVLILIYTDTFPVGYGWNLEEPYRLLWLWMM